MKKKLVSCLLAGAMIMSAPLASVFNFDEPVSLAWETELPSGQPGGTGGGGGTGQGGGNTAFSFNAEGSTIKDGETGVPKNALLMLLYSNNVSGPEVLEQNAEKISVTDSEGNPVEITVTSVPEGKTVEDEFEYRRYLSINIKDFKAGEKYTITVAPGIQAKNGTVLDDGYSITFTTAEEGEEPAEVVVNPDAAYLNGYTDGSMKPDAQITRAEVSKILKSVITEAPDAENPAAVTDINSDAWYAGDVEFAVNKGLMKGYEDKTFRPDNNMTRAEFVTAILKLTELKSGDAPFSDIGEHWAKANIVSAYVNELINGYNDGTFKPDASITRVEVAKIMNLVIGKERNLEEEKNNIKDYTDLTDAHWGYESIITATLN